MSGQAAVVIQVREIHGDVIMHPSDGGDTPPLLVTPTLTWAKERYGMHAVVDAPLSQAPSGTSLQGMIKFLADHEVEPPPDNTRLKLLVEGTRPQAVVLTDLIISVTGRRPAPPANHIELFSAQLFHKLEPKWFRADLRMRNLVPVGPNRAHGEAGEFPYYVHQGAPEQFAIDLELGGQVVEWVAGLHWTCAGRSGVLEISNQGVPFVSHPGNRPRYDWNFNAEQWLSATRV